MNLRADDVYVPFGVHDFSQGRRTQADYHRLLAEKGDTRNRLFGVPFHSGTFNAHTRARSYGSIGVHPKGEYRFRQGSVQTWPPLTGEQQSSAIWAHHLGSKQPRASGSATPSSEVPASARSASSGPGEWFSDRQALQPMIRGGRIREWIPGDGMAGRPSQSGAWDGWSAERSRKAGGNGRTIDSNCTVKDGIHVYYGPTNGHYGSNSGSHNKAMYRPAG
eukprot:TRINITY_DN36074_c0_g1_i1.p1 TRINITY_DN36074_c0_g1~~TRINITY_DN36074_c0_g1_i1.p1  ORF type:complete len:220 (+),score=20.33 TRINITY_DN36074_c0_g1_i1:93-752(+)